MKKLSIVVIVLIAVLSGFAGSWLFQISSNSQLSEKPVFLTSPQAPVSFSSVRSVSPNFREDFISASEITTPSVVFVKVQSVGRRAPANDFWMWNFFGNPGPVNSTGSGVIISEDGYIVTNHHVVKDGQQIEVVVNGRKLNYPAQIVGVDPSTDLAVLKIDADKLPAVSFANSDNLSIGEWVLAVGNPFDLTSTVTSGIVSAKGRNINILRNQFPIESFIQTDAAINPGNSGGALVNLDGELVGINTAILSRTGSYAGYGFAIPSNIVRKVAQDLIEFGIVQRAFLDAEVSDITPELAKKLNDYRINGVHVDVIYPKGNAEKAGLQKGDIILQINGNRILNRAIFDEQLAYYRPGNQIKLMVKRGNSTRELNLTLTNSNGGLELVKNTSVQSTTLGASFQELTKVERDRLNITSGIRISDIRQGAIRRMGLPDGFVVQKVNGKEHRSPAELVKALENATGRTVIEGVNPNGSRATYSFHVF